MLRETLKREIDKLSDSQLRRIADFVALIKTQAQQLPDAIPFWQRAMPSERAEDFRTWVSQLPETHISLPDEAFDRGNLYDE